MHKNNVLLHLSLIDGVGPSVISKIIIFLSENKAWQDVYTFMPSDFMQMDVSASIAAKIVSGLRDRKLLDHELELMKKHTIRCVVFGSPEYPELLSHIVVPPPVLYVQGRDLSSYKKSIAVVGSRKADTYGAQVVHELVPPLVSHGWTIVSGGALGVDSLAHKATLKSAGSTVAVLGSGLLSLYPVSNKLLFQEIIDRGGTLVSPFPLELPPHPGNFPARNRIISGLSRGCIVVQAARKSGARITANYALEQGREVFAVPGLIGNELSVGCHDLIQLGAKLVTNTDDVLVEFSEGAGVAGFGKSSPHVDKKAPLALGAADKSKQFSIDSVIHTESDRTSYTTRMSRPGETYADSNVVSHSAFARVAADVGAISTHMYTDPNYLKKHAEKRDAPKSFLPPKSEKKLARNSVVNSKHGGVSDTKQSKKSAGLSAKNKSENNTQALIGVTAGNNQFQTQAVAHSYNSDSIEARIMVLCISPSSVDDLISSLNLELAQVQGILFGMQLDGTLKQDFTGRWLVK